MKIAYPDLFAPQTDEDALRDEQDYQKLKADIGGSGLLVPIEIDAETREILDGARRYRACWELGIELGVEHFREHHFTDEAERKWFAAKLNLLRRHLSPPQQAAYIVLYQLAPEEHKARARQREGGLLAGRGRPAEKVEGDLPQPIARAPQVVEILAHEYGLKPSMITRVKRIHEESSPLFADVLAGTRTPNEAIEILHPEKKAARQASERRRGQRDRARGGRAQAGGAEELRFCQHLLAGLKRKRKEAHDVQINSRWNPHSVRVMELHDVLDWVEAEVEAFLTTQRVSQDTPAKQVGSSRYRSSHVQESESRINGINP